MKQRPGNKRGGLLKVAAGLASSYLAYRLAQDARVKMRNQRLQRGKRIVILGAGFGGREVALELARQLPEAQDGEIILVDQDCYLLFTPMLTEVAGGELDPEHIARSQTHPGGRPPGAGARIGQQLPPHSRAGGTLLAPIGAGPESESQIGSRKFVARINNFLSG
jgi:hypothetical protein